MCETEATSSEEGDLPDHAMEISGEGEETEGHSFIQDGINLPTLSVMLHDYCGAVCPSTVANKTGVVASCMTDEIYFVTRESATQTASMHSKDQETQTEDLPDFIPMRYEHISGSDKNVRLYTGLPNADTFQMLFDELPPVQNETKTGRPKTMRLIDEFLLVMMRLKLGLVIADLAFRFGVSTAVCRSVINRWIKHLYCQLSFLTYWPTRAQVQNTMPEDFRLRFPTTRVVIDCTELLTETPSSLATQSLMWSQYKGHTTWKALVGITPNGVVSFVSDLWAGSISDKEIIQKSKILDLLESGDSIMGDKGFLISDLTTPLGIELIVPPKKSNKKQMSPRDIELTRRVANCRIHVERHMQRVKKWRILHNLTGTMKQSVSEIWKICNNLTALLPPLHAGPD